MGESAEGRDARMSARDHDYVLGTHDAEIERLGLQHRVWRPATADAWRRAGFGAGQTLLDIGCGPGYASLDLAEIAGPSGKVFAFDRSRRFLDALEAAARGGRGAAISAREIDLERSPLPDAEADGAWCRWVFAFMKDPRGLLERVAAALRPGGTMVIHEYFDYATWRLAPRSPELEEFVRIVMESWRAGGGEPDIALDLPGWLEELGCGIVSARPIVHIAGPSDPVWEWPKAFIDVNLLRLVELGLLPAARAGAIKAAFDARERAPGTRMITPAVLEIIARRP
jgi:SAM-dependent methyltransferase